MTASAGVHLATESYSKLLSAKTGPFRVVELMSTTGTNDEDSTRLTLSVDPPTVTSNAKKRPAEHKKTKDDDNDAD